jgi:flagellar biosynthesis/type III secretory pathway M-ring protein FliF/YscJ
MNPFKDGNKNTAWVYVLALVVAIAGVAFLKWWEIHTAMRALQEVTSSMTMGSQVMVANLHQDLDKSNARQVERARMMNEEAKYKSRLNSIRGCSTNVKRDSCKCFDGSGSVESVLDQRQCLAVVDRGLAAIQDF